MSTHASTHLHQGVSRSARKGYQQQSATHSFEGCVTIDGLQTRLRDCFRRGLIRSAGKARRRPSRTTAATGIKPEQRVSLQGACFRPSARPYDTSSTGLSCAGRSAVHHGLSWNSSRAPLQRHSLAPSSSVPAAQKRLFAGGAQIGWSGMYGRITRPRHCYGGVRIAALVPIHPSSALPLQGWQRSSSRAGRLAACHNGPPPRRPLLQFRQGLDRTGVDRCLTHLVGNGLVTAGLSTDDATVRTGVVLNLANRSLLLHRHCRPLGVLAHHICHYPSSTVDYTQPFHLVITRSPFT